MKYIIKNDILTVTVDSHGAEIVSVKKNGKELLWQNQTGEWNRHAPILFPVCGCCQFNFEGVEYGMPKHGFARNFEFDLLLQEDTSVTLIMTSNEITRKIYPFDFDFSATYTVEESGIVIQWKIANRSSTPMYFYCGGHEAHYLPKTIDKYQLVFENVEVLDSLKDDGGILNGERTSYGIGKIFNIPIDALSNQKSLIFGSLKSGEVTLKEIGGDAILTETFEGFSNMLLWSPDGRHALCIEPWQNLPDSLANRKDDIRDKDNIQILPSGKGLSISRRIFYH